jgi:excisionase family DNA binding protein
MTDKPERRFLKLEEAAEMFSVSNAQMYALVRRGEIRAIKLGGRGQWRVALTDLDEWVERMYAETDAWVKEHPFSEADAKPLDQDPDQ